MAPALSDFLPSCLREHAPCPLTKTLKARSARTHSRHLHTLRSPGQDEFLTRTLRARHSPAHKPTFCLHCPQGEAHSVSGWVGGHTPNCHAPLSPWACSPPHTCPSVLTARTGDLPCLTPHARVKSLVCCAYMMSSVSRPHSPLPSGVPAPPSPVPYTQQRFPRDAEMRSPGWCRRLSAAEAEYCTEFSSFWNTLQISMLLQPVV